ncbi:porin family protein [Siphonobacter curvatus]|uniref:Porin family protein n=2 Tax=Siphonobacter TaxID=700450 RepID=A0A2S7INK5_9BACT|nr:porin family protein [Siphonobacter curvatus]PQA59311.1 porin family protein [Siphonobacter curvatus]
MKKYIFAAFLAIAMVRGAQAQDNLSWGLMGGVSIAKFGGGGAGNANFKTGGTGGLFINYSINERFGVGGQALYTQLGSKFGGLPTEVRLNYLQIPILATFYLNDRGAAFRPKIFAGPYVGFLLGARNENGDNINANKDRYTAADAGLHLGAGFNYRLSDRVWLNFDARYGLGLVNVAKPVYGSGDINNRNIGINLGVSFPLGKYQPSTGRFTSSRR